MSDVKGRSCKWLSLNPDVPLSPTERLSAELYKPLYLLSTSGQTDKVTGWTKVDKAERLAANMLDISLRSQWRPKTELKEETFNRQVARSMTPNEC